MDSDLDVQSITYLKNHAAELISQICEEGRAVTITQNGAARVVVVGVDRYQQMQQALLMSRLVGLGRAEAEAGRVRSHADVFDRLEAIASDAASDDG